VSDWPLGMVFRRLSLRVLDVFEFAIQQGTLTDAISDHAVCYNSLIKPVSSRLFVLKPTQLHNEAVFEGEGTYSQSGQELQTEHFNVYLQHSKPCTPETRKSDTDT
jgi:hypothetical protein